MAGGSFGGGNGTTSNPYLVEDAQDLNAVRNYLGNASICFLQTQDIDMASFGNFIPIQRGASYLRQDLFCGVYDGGGYEIQNVICKHKRSYVGIFGGTEGAKLSNIIVVNCDISGINYVGGLVGDTRGITTIERCYVNGSISGSFVGGLIGYSYNSKVSNCYTSCDVIGGSYVGGLIGFDAYESIIEKCYTLCDVIGTNYIGGLIGFITTRSTISNCYAINLSIEKIGSAGTYFGDIVGYNESSFIRKSYSLDIIKSNVALTINSTGRITETQAKQRATYESILTNWDFENVWTIKEGQEYPKLQWQVDEEVVIIYQCQSMPFPLRMKQMTQALT